VTPRTSPHVAENSDRKTLSASVFEVLFFVRFFVAIVPSDPKVKTRKAGLRIESLS
jgi:hypothetical protein